MQQIGFLGLGIMGCAMVKNLLKSGFKVIVWNRSPEKCAELESIGVRQARNPAVVMASCDVTFAMLADPEAAEAVCFGPDGILAGIAEGRGYVDMSTVDDMTAQKIAKAITNRGGRYLEAPVSGSKKPAEDGTLIFLTAGDRSLHDEALPALEKMGKKIIYLGEAGNAARMKLVVNMIMGGMMGIFCEGMALAEKAGIAYSDLLEVLDAGAIANPMFKLKGGLIANGNYTVNFPLKHMQKDLRLAVSLGDNLRQPLPTAACVNEQFKRARAAGLDDEDFSAIYKIIG